MLICQKCRVRIEDKEIVGIMHNYTRTEGGSYSYYHEECAPPDSDTSKICAKVIDDMEVSCSPVHTRRKKYGGKQESKIGHRVRKGKPQRSKL